MRRFFIFIAFALCSFWQLRAQADTASFLFDKYEDAQVVLRAGGEMKKKMNFKALRINMILTLFPLLLPRVRTELR